MTTMDWVREYLGMGWSLCALRPGEKGPYMQAWGTLDLDEGHWRSYPDDGCGVLLGRSGLATIDVDDMSSAKAALGALGIDLVGLLEAPDAVRIVSRPGRAKLVYRVREDQAAHVCRKRALNWRTLDGTSFCVVEFRAGSGQLQDVLPPSIHPATGEPYAWAGDFRRIPGLPDELAAVWEMWDDAVRVMREADPCKAKAQTVPKREVRFHGSKSTGDVIGKWNDAYDVRDVMSRPALTALYEEVGNRWRRRGSQDKAGVVLLEDRQHAGRMRVYSHHGGDPLIPYTATDAFGLFCLAEHGGDDRAAVKAAAFELGLPPLVGLGEIKAVGEEQVQALVASAGGSVAHVGVGSEGEGGSREDRGSAEVIRWPGAPVLPDQDAPDDIAPAAETIPVRGMPVPAAQELWDWIAGSVRRGKASAVTQTTLSLICHLAGRRYVSESGIMPGVLFAVLDDATVNLAPYLRCEDDLLDLIGGYDAGNIGGEIRYLTEKAGNEISTTANLVEHYRKSPRLLWGSTSIATMLERESRQINPNFQTMLDKLGEIRHGASLHYAPSKGDTYTVRVPAVTALWALTPHSVGGLVRTTTRSGLLQQTLVADAGTESTGGFAQAPLPDSALEALKRLTSRTARATHVFPEDDFQRYAPMRVPVTAEARAAFVQLAEQIRAACGAGDRLREYPLRGASRGWVEAAESIALGLAALRDTQAPEIDGELAQWSCSWAGDCWRVFQARIGVASEDSADVERAVLERLRAVGRDGATTSELRRSLRVLRALSAERREEVLETMESDGLIASARKTGGKRWYLRRQAP